MHANLLFVPLFATLVCATGARAQSLESNLRTTGPGVTAVFEPQRLVIQQSSAVIYQGRTELVYGVVITPDGDVLTKASEIHGIDGAKLAVAIDETKYTEVEILGIDPVWDVAHLKVKAKDLKPVVYAPTSAVPQGTWVVANGATTRTKRRVLGGIVSAKIREIPTAGGAALGITLAEIKKGAPDKLVIEELNEKSGAKEAGLQPGDEITAIEGKPVKNREDIAKSLKDRKAGAIIKVTYRRKGESLTVDVRLMAREEMVDQMSRNDQMSGEFSAHRSGFPRILQHDILGAKRSVGGPLLDLDGRCVGMNIARANRAESFAIPVEDLKAITERMLRHAKDRAAEPAAPAPETPPAPSID